MNRLLLLLMSALCPDVLAEDRLNRDCASCLWSALWEGRAEWCVPCHREIRRGMQSHPFRKGASC
jgi:hypothetical protein